FIFLSVCVICKLCKLFFFFFFQAEDGIRDFHVTGVQTCALPILIFEELKHIENYIVIQQLRFPNRLEMSMLDVEPYLDYRITARSEERRVGKECRSRWSPDR